MNRTEQNRTEQNRTEQNRTEQNRTEQNRLIYVDNIKGLLIYCVVLGHFLAGTSYVSQFNVIGILHYFIYSVHMPMFILISGYLGKKDYSIKMILYKYLIPYIIFDLSYALIRAIAGDSSGLNILIPNFVYWYILCIAIMRLLTSHIEKNKLFLLSIICIIGSIIFSFWDLNESAWRFLSIGRVFLLFPIYLVGYLMSDKFVSDIRKRRIYGLIVPFVIIIEIVLLISGFVNVSWATHDMPVNLSDYLLKLVYMMLAVFLFLGLSCIIYKKECFLTKWGRNSILVYLIHPFLLIVIQSVFRMINIQNLYIILVSYILLSIVITQFLSMDILNNVYQSLLKYIANKLHLLEE